MKAVTVSFFLDFCYEEENNAYPCCSSCWCRQSDVSWAGWPAKYLLCTVLLPAYTPTRPCTALPSNIPDRKNLLVAYRTCYTFPLSDGYVNRDNLHSEFMENHWVSHCPMYPDFPDPSSLLNSIHLEIRIQTQGFDSKIFKTLVYKYSTKTAKNFRDQ